MKPIKTLFLLIAMLSPLAGAANVTFKFAAGTIKAGTLKTRMERNISALLTEIDRAGKSGTALNLTAISMEPQAKARLNALWDDSRFVCDKKRTSPNASTISRPIRCAPFPLP